jgi:MFS family permease
MISTSRLSTASLIKRSPIFYGWIVWAVAALGTAATSPGQSYSVSLFFDFFIEDFGLDRTTASGLYGLGTFVASLSLTWVGRKIDRYGNRRMSVIISTLFVLALIGFSFITGPIGLLVGFMSIRGLGQGALGLVNSTVIAQWFRQRRGRVMSLSMVVMSVFQAIYIPWLQGLLSSYDWRQVWLVLAAGVAVTFLPLGWLLMRNRPEDFGLQPDGIRKAENQTAAVEESEDNWTLREVIGTAIFWIFLLGKLLISAWGTGLTLHQLSLFAGHGHSPSVVAETYSIYALLMAGSALLFGYLIDRLRPGLIVALQMGCIAVTMLMAMVMTEGWMLFIYALTFAAATGGSMVFEGAVWANLFGRKYIGEIRGFTATTLVAGSALGPVVFGLGYDLLGGYNPVLWVGIIWAGIAAVLALVAPKPQRRVRSDAVPAGIGD